MSLALVNWYLGANELLLVAVLLLAALRAVSRRLGPFGYRHLLQLGYAISAAAVVLPLVDLELAGLGTDREPLIPHTAEVWSRSTMDDTTSGAAGDRKMTVSLVPVGTSISLSGAALIARYVFLSGLLIVLAKLAWDARAIATTIAGAHRLHRRGRVRVMVSDSIAVPFSFWLPGRTFIVVPTSLIQRPRDLRMAIRHEAQHHRQADTRVLYLYQLTRGIFYWNPAAHLLARQIFELQELACDEAVIARARACARAYCGCLLRMAEVASSRSQGLLSTGMAGRSTRALLRRVEAALHPPGSYVRKPLIVLTGTAAITVLTSVAIALGTPVKDRRIDLAEAQRMVIVARETSELPIALNDRILAQLNLLLATPDGRAFVRASLARMNQYEDLISRQIRRYGLPPELSAIPLVESGYRNLPAGPDPRRGAGLWMFIESTARRSGLTVTRDRDERLSVSGETTAAMQLLRSLQLRFNDWSLSLLAFNTGAVSVDRGIRETGSRDAWRLIRNGYENDPNYLARLMAMVLIIKNPDVLDEPRP